MKNRNSAGHLFKNLLFALVFILIYSGCLFAYTYSKPLDKVVTLMLEDDYYAALDECFQIQRQAQGNIKAEVLYMQGQCLVKLERFEEARNVFKKALSFTRGELSTEIYMGIADSYFMQQQYNKASVIYEQLLNKITDDDPYLAALYYKLGKSYQKESEWAETKYYFNLLKTKFPDSFEAQLVKKSSVGGNFFTIQVGCFSNQKNAEKLQNDLKIKGYDVYVTPFNSKSGRLYRVRVGEFMSRIAAEHKERELRTQENLPTHIFP